MQLKKNGGYAYIVADVTDTLSSGVNCVAKMNGDNIYISRG